MNFNGRVAVVTGAAMGIGRAVVEAFAEEGASVVIVDIDAQAGEALKKELEKSGKKASFIQANISDEKEVKSLFDKVNSLWNRLDFLVNNAGIYFQGDITATSGDIWNRVLSVNLTGAFLCSKYAVPAMLANQGGVIVNVASEAGLVGIAGQVAYNVSKAGVIALTRSCAVDLASRGIRVNCVCPGTTDTPLVKAAVNRAADPVEARRKLESVRPLNRLGKPEEIASAIVYLCSDLAGYATGSIFSMDGGYTAQ